MVNTAQQGARLEREVRQLFDDRGFLTARCAGSQGSVKFDVFACHPDGRSYVIQCKLSNPLISPAERTAMVTVANVIYAAPLVAYRSREGRRSFIRFRELTGPGPKEWRAWSLPGEDES